MPKIDLDEVRAIWAKHIGFMPEAVATFDHMTVGFPSRLLTGYSEFRRICREKGVNEARTVSVVVDTLLPYREKPCGVSPELGLIPAQQTTWVESSQVFFFRNSFRFPFKEVRNDFERSLDASLIKLKKQQRPVRHDRVMACFDELGHLWSGVRSCSDAVKARDKLLRSLGVEFAGKRILRSELLRAEADVLDYLVQAGVSLEECPGALETGLARLVLPDGREGEIVRRWDPSISDAMRAETPSAIPTAPITILISSLPFPHYGNDYGMLAAAARWQELGIPQRLAEDGQNSWPVGTLYEPNTKRTLRGLWSDLFYWGREDYLRLVEQSMERKAPVFDCRMSDWP